MTTKLLIGRKVVSLSEVEGLPLPPLPNLTSWRKQISIIRELEMRKDDVLICAYPKAGTHWLWEIISMLLAGEASYESRAKELLMLDLTSQKKFARLASPRVLNTHLPFAMLPTDSLRARRVKVVHVYRNPRDVMVSMYHHFRQFKLEHTESVQQYCKAFLEGKVAYGHYATYLNQMNSFIKDNPDLPVYTLSYEQMKLDPHSTVRSVAEYLELGPQVSDSLVSEVVEACTFSNMKKADCSKEQVKFLGVQLEQKLYRKGEVGDWSNHMTEEETEEFDREFHKRLDNDCFSFHYAL